MGKIKKIKQERKRAEVETQIKKAKNKRLYVRLILILMFIFALTFLGSIGYKKYENQINKIATKTKEILRISQGGSSTQKSEEKVERPSTNTQDNKKTYDKAPDMQIDVNKKYTAKFETSKGNFEIELYADKAPKTVNNFVVLSKDKFYDGLTFHRVIKDFMIQGGDPNGDGTGDPGYKFEDEINDVKLVRGVLAMANSGANTNGSQFFIVTKEATDWLDGKHTAFGSVSSGMDVVMDIEKVEVGENDKPNETVTITKITIEEK